ncbi:hypothetical protein NM208_g5916 [Fusarium decemcellulare]|uniref:Uncharacterized protein n=1 Tax=Fusarium decemcellulare TaxID=57161 RepID=A0ACC1SF31_9HYPO|nr:hypothetical protein NM208_g5916 [Fusarium decemcellulare]
MRLTHTLMFMATANIASSITLPLVRRQQTNPAPIRLIQNGVAFEVQVQINNQTFYVTPDTGSSDLWVPIANFQCVNGTTGQDVPQEDCAFGATFNVPESMEYVANQTFGVQYGTGIAVGKVALATVSINGFTVPHQKIGLVDRTDENGSGSGSGVLGLGFPPLTSAHPGTSIDNATLLLNRAVYDPVFVNMYKQGLVSSWYSFAIERPPNNATSGLGGWLGLGELPPVSHSNDWATKPIEVTEGLPDELTQGKRVISLMTLTVDGVSWGNGLSSHTTNSTRFQAVVDTGNHMNLLPETIAESINAAFDPPGIFDKEAHVYMVDCNATTPDLGITLDGHTFWHQSPEDLIYRDISGFCYSSVGPTGRGSGLEINFLGDAFLRNVVSVYDFGKREMRFAARTEVDRDSAPPRPVSSSATTPARSPWFSFVCVFILGVVSLI